jgi:hypothetical protein
VILLIGFGLVVWRWIVADREKLGNRLTEITDKYIQMGERMTEVVTNNTNAFREVKEVMSDCAEELKRKR